MKKFAIIFGIILALALTATAFAASQFTVGKATGTGTPIYVCIGYEPSTVDLQVYRETGAGTDFASLSYWKNQSATSSTRAMLLQGGVVSMIAGTTPQMSAYITSTVLGIKPYVGGRELRYFSTSAIWKTLVGAVATSTSTGIFVNADGTGYGANLVANAVSGQIIKTPPGFIIGVDPQINTGARSIFFKAFE